MPLTLPPGAIVSTVTGDPDLVLTGNRVTSYRFDLLDATENLLGTLDGVQPGGAAEWHAFASVKGGGTITVLDRGQNIDWLNVRVRPMTTIARLGGGAPSREVACGVFLCAAPVETWTATGRAWSVELLDKCSILDQDIVTTDAGVPVTFTAPVGANVIATVVSVIQATGETTPAILPSDKVLTMAQVWDVGTTRLQIVNDLLSSAGFFSLWCDGMGQFQVSPYVAPGNRAPVYAALVPFSKGDFSLMSPDWTRDRDIYSIPNRYVAISQGNGVTEALVAVATNEDPTSPFSFPSRGRWITRVTTGVEATTIADLQSRAAQGLSASSSVTSGISLQHVFLPELLVNSVVRFVNPDAGLDITCSITVTNIPFDPLALCSSEIREVVV